MRPKASILIVLALCLNCRASTSAQPTPDDGLGELLRSMVTDSLVGGGRRSDQRYVAANAATDSLLRAAGFDLTPRSDAPRPACPSSTDSAGEPVAREVGYIVRVDRTEPAHGVLRLDVTLSCEFVFRGRPRGFAQGSIWELRQVSGRWRVNRTFGRRIT
jgi:hypothetical protein